MVFNLIAVYTETYLPGHFHRRIKKEIDGEWMRSYLFKRDMEISAGQKNANFEVRLYRLMKKVEEAAPSITIVKSGRGRITLESNSELDLRET